MAKTEDIKEQFAYELSVSRESPERGTVVVERVNDTYFNDGKGSKWNLVYIEGSWRAYNDDGKEWNIGRRSFWMTVKDLTMILNEELQNG